MNPFIEKHYREVFLNLFIITLVGGSFMLEHTIAGVTFYAFRDFLVVGLAFLLINKRIKLYTNKVTKLSFYILVIWLLYAITSITWCLDRTVAYKDIMYLLWAISTFVFLVSLKYKYKDFGNDLVKNWGLVFIVVSVFATWEIYTAKHIVSSFTEILSQIARWRKLNFVPVFTFDNPNHFALYTCFSSALFIGAIIRKKIIAMSSFLLAICLFIVHLEEARFGLITIAIYAIIIIIYYQITNSKINLKASLKTFGSLIFTFTFLLIGVFGTNDLNIKSKSGNSPPPPPVQDHSVFIRKNLIMNGLDFFIESKGLGVGAGNFKTYIQRGKGELDTGTVISPHNWFIEILSQYGILIIALCFLWGGYIVKLLYQSIKKEKLAEKHLLIILLLFCYVIMSNANSSFMSIPLNWLMFSLIALFTDDLLENKKQENA